MTLAVKAFRGKSSVTHDVYDSRQQGVDNFARHVIKLDDYSRHGVNDDAQHDTDDSYQQDDSELLIQDVRLQINSCVSMFVQFCSFCICMYPSKGTCKDDTSKFIQKEQKNKCNITCHTLILTSQSRLFAGINSVW